MIFRRWFIRMGQRCYICRKSVWFFQRWFSTLDNRLFHRVCVMRCHCMECKEIHMEV